MTVFSILRIYRVQFFKGDRPSKATVNCEEILHHGLASYRAPLGATNHKNNQQLGDCGSSGVLRGPGPGTAAIRD